MSFKFKVSGFKLMNLLHVKKENPGPGPVEFILLMAVLMSLTALSLDTMLPALPAMGHDLQVHRANDVQLIISTLILGLSLGQLLFGPLSDSVGRKPALVVGIFFFLAGCAICLLSDLFAMVLAGRIIQGIGASGPRLVVVALIRDRYEGRTMAKVMSSIMSIFIVIPAFAPAIGQGILAIAGWRSIFGMLLILAAMVLAWFAWRQPETLMPDRRIPFSFTRVIHAFGEVCNNRFSIGYTLVAGLTLGAFLGYLNCAQQIFQEIYGLQALFPVYFGALALSLGCASFFNARIVMRFGTRKIVYGAIRTMAALSLAYTIIVYRVNGLSIDICRALDR